ncbi:MAG: hypothetical protein JZU53_04555 [Paludibacter sp.]|nr:hypothetical protein [Paludibacter sp.]
MADYIPTKDPEFDLWQDNLVDNIRQFMPIWGISSEEEQRLGSKQSLWKTAFSKTSNKQNRTAADVQAKNDALDDYKKEIRSFVTEFLASNSLVTDSDRTRMGLTVKSGTRTATPVPTTSPLGTVDFSVRLQHTLHLSDNATPQSKAKPAGVHGCEVWVKLGGDAPKDASELSYLGVSTTNAYTATYEGKQANTMAYYWLRWVNTRGEHGPWSGTVNSIIVG